MISRDKFVELIEFIEKQNSLENRLCDVLEEMSPGSYVDAFIFSEYENKLTDVIMLDLELDDNKGDIFTWWLYDEEYGHRIADESGEMSEELRNLTDAGKLYDYLVEVK